MDIFGEKDHESGSSHDWAYIFGGTRVAFAIELRDTGHSGFLLPPSEIKPQGEEMWAAMLAVIPEYLRFRPRNLTMK